MRTRRFLITNHFTNEKKSPELCLEAVKNTGWAALIYVPEKLKTSELCFEALKRSKSRSLKYVPEALQKEVWTKLKNAL